MSGSRLECKLKVRAISVADISLPKRKEHKELVKKLVESIKDVGLINPILVERSRGRYSFRLIDGLQRILALKKLNKPTVLALIKETNVRTKNV